MHMQSWLLKLNIFFWSLLITSLFSKLDGSIWQILRTFGHDSHSTTPAHTYPSSFMLQRRKPPPADRKAAENAIHMRRVDDQVSKAVRGSNMADTAARVTTIKAVQNQIQGKCLI